MGIAAMHGTSGLPKTNRFVGATVPKGEKVTTLNDLHVTTLSPSHPNTTFNEPLFGDMNWWRNRFLRQKVHQPTNNNRRIIPISFFS